MSFSLLCRHICIELFPFPLTLAQDLCTAQQSPARRITERDLNREPFLRRAGAALSHATPPLRYTTTLIHSTTFPNRNFFLFFKQIIKIYLKGIYYSLNYKSVKDIRKIGTKRAKRNSRNFIFSLTKLPRYTFQSQRSPVSCFLLFMVYHIIGFCTGTCNREPGRGPPPPQPSGWFPHVSS
jgi:hypothetical protein